MFNTTMATILDFFQSPLAVYLGIALATLLLVSSLFVQEKETKLLPGGSMGWPILGETLGFLKPHKSNTMGSFLQHHISRYGKVFKSNLFLSRTIVSGDLELNHFIFKNEGKLFQNTYPKSVKDIMGNLSLMLVLDGEIHRRLRTAAVNFIGTSKSSPNFIRYIEKLTILRLSTWNEHGEILFAKEAKKFIFHLMLKNLLNIEPGEPLASQLLEDYLKYMKGFVSLPLYVPGTPYAKGLKARARIASTVKGIIEERENHGEYMGIAEGGDFLDEMLMKRELNNEETVSLVMDLLLAGYETTAGLLAVSLYFLAQTPQALDQLKQEHLALKSKKKDGETLTWEDIQQLEFNSYVIHEALRCGNLVKFLHRIALEDVKFKEYFIPKGWQVLPMFTAVHMDPSLHESPSVFNPWRWKDQSTTKKVNPFGGGKRQCPGIDLAKLEVTVFLHHLVLNYSWKMKDDDDYPVSYPYLDFKKGLKLKIKPIEENYIG